MEGTSRMINPKKKALQASNSLVFKIGPEAICTASDKNLASVSNEEAESQRSPSMKETDATIEVGEVVGFHMAGRESKLADHSMVNFQRFWDASPFNFDYVNGNGRTGGIICIWDTGAMIP
ncbi:hypothetical protein QVD17_17433 [Tagetes erecta]|uniref:Uncharacterized protein n=1 Tax=Tagetes erecta TaxID=13708 RepID=A0AAD8NUC2_TARER|nr:hypothetical protein QVD17_17433 [Tagetes erecta]